MEMALSIVILFGGDAKKISGLPTLPPILLYETARLRSTLNLFYHQ
jgi:hypothetical protein